MSFLVALPEDQYSPTAFARFSAANPSILDNARAMMWLSQLAYETDNPEKVERIGRSWGLAPIKSFKQHSKSVLRMSNTRGIVANKDNATIICFCGTDPLGLLDWVADLRSRQSADHLHEGFQDAVDAVWKKELCPVFEIVNATGSPLMFSGHSLGGALAVVAAWRALQEQKLQKADVYTFGMPRVGSPDFAERYGELANTTYRFIHGQDIVPTVPPTEFEFVHVGRHFHCASGGRFVADGNPVGVGEEEVASDSGIFSYLSDQFRRLTSRSSSAAFRTDLLGQMSRVLPAGISDHLPDRYYHALGN